MRPGITLVAAICASLAGCATPDRRVEVPPGDPTADPRYGALPSPRERAASITRRSEDVDPLVPRPGYTYAFEDFAHGVQVEYFSTDGRAFLWYPGNFRVVPGEYRYRVAFYEDGEARVSRLAFRYPSRSYNPVTGRRGGSWSERNQSSLANRVVSYVEGDVFDLSSGRVPFRLGECQLPEPMIYMPPGGGPRC